jgi:uncharacterized membrane protein YczE
VGPWDAFHQGLHLQLGIGIGTASIAVGVLVLLLSLPLGIRPGAGTVANMVLIGAATDLLLPVVPPRPDGRGDWLPSRGDRAGRLVHRRLHRCGPGQGAARRLVLGLAERWRWPVRRVRTLVELSVLGAVGLSVARSGSER